MLGTKPLTDDEMFPSPRGDKLQFMANRDYKKEYVFPSPCGDKLQ